MEKLKRYYLLVILIVAQTIFYIIAGSFKTDIHIDEAYSFGLSNYDQIEIEENKDFFDNWHTKEYYEDYLTVQKDEIGNFKPVYENQKNDVHPPIYYLILRVSMEIAGEYFSKWTGIILNIVIYAFITVFMYLILKQLFKDEKYQDQKAIILSFMSSSILASISNAIYIRMYALLTLIILITLFLHIKLLASQKINIKLLISIGVCALTGILTHYYFIFYLGFIYLFVLFKYIKERKIKELIYYTCTIALSGIISLVIFPYSIQHMFFGYRGQGVISNFEHIGKTLISIFPHIHNLNYYGFNGTLYIVLIMISLFMIVKKVRKTKDLGLSIYKKDILKIIIIPSILFFIIASIASPWKVLRYIVPVCSLLFVAIIYILYILLKNIYNEKISNIIMSIVFCVILLMPIIANLEPELLYYERKNIISKLEDELNLPTLYLYDPKSDGFLNNIYLFSKIDEVYITKSEEYTEANIQSIMESKDLSNGMIVVISENSDIDSILQVVKNSTGLKNVEYLDKLTSSKVYYIK